jgi:OmcA/MtrC family decaheme c-type cytochrome
MQRLAPRTVAASLAVLSTVAALAALSGCGKARPPVPPSQTSAGLVLTIQDARVDPASRTVTVTYRLTDSSGAPQGFAGVSNRWTLAQLVTTTENQVSLLAYQSLVMSDYPPSSSNGGAGFTLPPGARMPNAECEVAGAGCPAVGVHTELGAGRFRYTFQTVLPQGYDPNATTFRVGVWASRTTAVNVQLAADDSPDVASDVANATFDFTPTAGTPAVREFASEQSCNACHGTIKAHGGFRRDLRLCTTCHTTQLFDPDTEDPAVSGAANGLELQTLVHRIHRGTGLPTVAKATAAGVKYSVIGYMNQETVYAQTVTDRATGTGVTVEGVGLPQDIRNCAVCHAGNAPADQPWAALQPTVSACTSCHADITFGGGTPPPLHKAHPVAVAATSRCAGCHDSGTPKTGEYGPSVAGAHTVPLLSAEANPLDIAIVDVTNTGAGQNPRVRFTVKNHGDGASLGTLTSSVLNRIAVTVGGPTSDYAAGNVVTETIVGGGGKLTSLAPDGNGVYQYDLTATLPAGAAGQTFAIGLEARRPKTIKATYNPGRTPAITFNDSAYNPVSYFAVGGGTAEPRRQVVAFESCNACHLQLAAHGDLRHNPQYCIMCHTPDATDAVMRPTAPIDQLQARGIHLKTMVHRLHTGADLDASRVPLTTVDAGFLVYGFGKSPVFLDEAEYPGTRARCTACHVGASFTLESLPVNALASVDQVQGGQTVTVPPMQASCLACHDTAGAAAHAAQYTTSAGESCRTCHGQGHFADVSAVHAAFVR